MQELEGLAFRCLEGCGFCCTFTPEVAHDDVPRLRAVRPGLPLVRDGPTLRIALQGGCGACTLLERRACTAYDARPAHCRYFPFHVYFGRATEVYVNRSCRGVEESAGTLRGAFQAQVAAVAPRHAVAEGQRQADRVHLEFARRARDAGAWADVDGALAEALAGPGLWARAGAPDAWAAALAPFAESDVVARPYYLDRDLRWLTFEATGDAGLQPIRMEEDGSLSREGPVLPVAPPDPRVGARLEPALRRAAGRDLMAGSVFDAVDASGYELGVAAAARTRVTQVAADLLARWAILEALGVPDGVRGDEAVRFHDGAFLDAPTIGGWL